MRQAIATVAKLCISRLTFCEKRLTYRTASWIMSDRAVINYMLPIGRDRRRIQVYKYDEIEDIIEFINQETNRQDLCAWSIADSKFDLPFNRRFVDLYDPGAVYIFKNKLRVQSRWTIDNAEPELRPLEVDKETTFADLCELNKITKVIKSARVGNKAINPWVPLLPVLRNLPNSPWEPVEILVTTDGECTQNLNVVGVLSEQGVKEWKNVRLNEITLPKLKQALNLDDFCCFFNNDGQMLDADIPDKIYFMQIPLAVTDKVIEHLSCFNDYPKLHGLDDSDLRMLICFIMYWRLNGPYTDELSKAFETIPCFNLPPFQASMRKLIQKEPVTDLDLAIILQSISVFVKSQSRSIRDWGTLCDSLLKLSPGVFGVVEDEKFLLSCEGMRVVRTDGNYKLFLGRTPDGECVFVDTDGSVEARDLCSDVELVSEMTVVLVDNSGTMLTMFGKDDRSKLDGAHEILSEMSKAIMKPPPRYSVVFLSDVVKEDFELEWSRNLRVDDIERWQRVTRTRLWDSISKIIEKMPDVEPNTRRRIVVLTDGVDGRQEQQANALKTAAEHDIVIDGIILGEDDEITRQFACACRITGGCAFRFDSTEEAKTFVASMPFLDLIGRDIVRTPPLNNDQVKTLSKDVAFSTKINRRYNMTYPGELKRISLFPNPKEARVRRILRAMGEVDNHENVVETLHWDDINVWCVLLQIPDFSVFWDVCIQFPAAFPDAPPEFIIPSSRGIDGLVDENHCYKSESTDICHVLDDIINRIQDELRYKDDFLKGLAATCAATFPAVSAPFPREDFFTMLYVIHGEKRTGKGCGSGVVTRRSPVTGREFNEGVNWHGLVVPQEEADRLQALVEGT